jgi:hypothetical protein
VNNNRDCLDPFGFLKKPFSKAEMVPYGLDFYPVSNGSMLNPIKIGYCWIIGLNEYRAR